MSVCLFVCHIQKQNIDITVLGKVPFILRPLTILKKKKKNQNFEIIVPSQGILEKVPFDFGFLSCSSIKFQNLKFMFMPQGHKYSKLSLTPNNSIELNLLTVPFNCDLDVGQCRRGPRVIRYNLMAETQLQYSSNERIIQWNSKLSFRAGKA